MQWDKCVFRLPVLAWPPSAETGLFVARAGERVLVFCTPMHGPGARAVARHQRRREKKTRVHANKCGKYYHPPSRWLSVLTVEPRRIPAADMLQRGRGEQEELTGAPSLIIESERQAPAGSNEEEEITASHSWEAGRETALQTRLHKQTTPPVGWPWNKVPPTEETKRKEKRNAKERR